MKTLALPIQRSDVRKSFGGFAKRGYQGCERDCVMDEMCKRLFKCSRVSSGHKSTTLEDERGHCIGTVRFEALSDGSSPAYIYDDACFDAAHNILPKSADIIYRHITNTIGKLVQVTFDETKIQLR